MSDGRPPLRAQRRAETQRTIQSHAVRLFTDRGYDATTVADVAEAAGVSPMTVYRHFPTKEDLVLVDELGRLIAERIATSSAEQPLVRRVGSALIDSAASLTSGENAAGRTGVENAGDLTGGEQFLLACLRLMVSTPALRAKHLDNTYALQQVIVDGLGAEASDPDTAFRTQAAVSACLAAMHTALVSWAEGEGRAELPELIAAALAAAFGDDLIEPLPDR